jgi:hypothetical protein
MEIKFFPCAHMRTLALRMANSVCQAAAQENPGPSFDCFAHTAVAFLSVSEESATAGDSS